VAKTNLLMGRTKCAGYSFCMVKWDNEFYCYGIGFEKLDTIDNQVGFKTINLTSDSIWTNLIDKEIIGVKVLWDIDEHAKEQTLDKGKVKTLRQAFQKYLSPGKPAYRSRFKYSVEDAIQLIRKFKGLSFIAHPHVIPDQSWIEEFISLGVDGLETIYPTMSPAKRLLYKEMAIKFNKLQSGGSDAHGSYKAFVKIGEVDIPYAWVEDMKRCLEMRKC